MVLSTACTTGIAGDGHDGGFDSISISNSNNSGCVGDATDDGGADDGSGSESFWEDRGGDSFNTDFQGVAPQTRLDDDPTGDQNHGAVWWRLVMLACRTVALMPEGRQALVSSNALFPLLTTFVSQLAAVEGPAEDSARRDARGLIELSAHMLDGRTSGGGGAVPQWTERDLEGSGDNRPVAKRQKVGICKSDVRPNPPELPSVTAPWTMAPQTATATTPSDVRGDTHAPVPSCSGCTANTTKGTAVIGLDGSVAAAAAPPPQLGAAVSQTYQAHAHASGPRELQHHHHALLLRLHSPLLAENLQLLLDLMLDEQAASVRPSRCVSSVPDSAGEGDPVNVQDVGCCSSGSDGGGNGVPSTGMIKGIHPLLRQQLWRKHQREDWEGEQEAQWIDRKQAVAALPVVQKSWRAAREAAVAAELAARRGGSPNGSAVVPPPHPPQPPPSEVLRGLACLVMLLADAAVEVRTVATT
ncbi:hypothetical protein VaNZ11_000246, partial [Volvox africanus]